MQRESKTHKTMKKDMIFFAADGVGLTSTSANHVANVAKEMIRNLESELAAMTFFSIEVALIGSKSVNRLSGGVGDADVAAVADRLYRIADAKSLIAWLREAIKAKERLLKEAGEVTLEEFAEMEGIELREYPKAGEVLTEDEYFAAKPLEERCRYYELETLAATLGKEIHPGGAFAEARSLLQDKTRNPHEVCGTGRDTLVYTYRPTVDSGLVEDVYFQLQKLYREAQARLNSLKHECQSAVNESAVRVKTEFALAVNEWTNERKLVEARHAEWVQRRTNEISAMKIRIPQSLRGIFEEVSRLGKKKE